MRAMAGNGCELCIFLFRSLLDNCYATSTGDSSSDSPHPTETLSSLLNDQSGGRGQLPDYGVVFLKLSTLNCAEGISKTTRGYFGIDMIISSGDKGKQTVQGFEFSPVLINFEISSG